MDDKHINSMTYKRMRFDDWRFIYLVAVILEQDLSSMLVFAFSLQK